MDFLETMNIPKGYLIPTSHASVGIDQANLHIEGVALVSIQANGITTRHPVYITHGTRGFYLSHQAQMDLSIVDDSFPRPQNRENVQGSTTASSDDGMSPCGCPKRQKPPPKPSHVPFPPVVENRQLLEKWLLDRYRASAFNVCEHQPLPRMTGRPMEIHLEENAAPKAFHTPIPVPHHWQKPVKAGLDRDVCIGTVEPVPQGTPTTWCHRMVIVSKANGEPRRAIDLQPLNAVTKRETHLAGK